MDSSEEKQRFDRARAALYRAHSEDPNIITVDGKQIPYETHYAQRMEHFLSLRAPEASEVLRLAIIAQHFRRWEVPRSDYPATKMGYHQWRAYLKDRQAQLAIREVCEAWRPDVFHENDRLAALIRKDGLKGASEDEDVQILEDVACLVFLDDQFEQFKEKHDADKMVNILRKTWVKMSTQGQAMALELPMSEECKCLVNRALNDES